MKKSLLFLLCLVSSFLYAQYPTSFDLRNYNGQNYVTSVKAQQGGTCWTHGAMAAIEGNLLITGAWSIAGEQGEPNLSEYHLDWWNGFNQHNNDDLNPATGNGLTVHNGGDYRVTSAYLSRGEGAVRDVDASLFSTAPLRIDSSYHFYYVRDIEWYSSDNERETIDIIKEKLMTMGVVGTCMCVGNFWSSGNIHYQDPSDINEPNHAIAIVGWDDHVVTPAHEPGAWLCKNSWGAGWGNGGYFWISYYDKHCGHHPQMGAISFQNIEPMNYDHIYYHDYHGWRDELLNCTQVFNRFVADDFELLESVSFFTAADSISYSISVFDNSVSGSLQNLLSVKSGFINHKGLHTIDLDSVVLLQPMNDFYISLTLENGGYPYDKTSSVPVLLGGSARTIVNSSSSMDQSYFLDMHGHWIDLYSIDSSANFCIKGLATKLLPGTSSLPSGDSSICKNQIYSVYQISNTDYASDHIWSITPSDAATVNSFDTIAYVYWNHDFSGLTHLTAVPVNSWGSGGSSPSLDIVVYDLPELNLGSDTSVCIGQPLVLSPNQLFSSYMWSDNSHDSVLALNTTVLGIGTHQFWLMATDDRGCVISDSITVEVVENVAVKNLTPEHIVIYPNPTSDFLHFDESIEINSTIQVVNIEGSIVYSGFLPQFVEKKLDVRLYPKGVYFVKVIAKDNWILLKFVKN